MKSSTKSWWQSYWEVHFLCLHIIWWLSWLCLSKWWNFGANCFYTSLTIVATCSFRFTSFMLCKSNCLQRGTVFVNGFLLVGSGICCSNPSPSAKLCSLITSLCYFVPFSIEQSLLSMSNWSFDGYSCNCFGVKSRFISSKYKSVYCNLDEVQALNTAKLSLTL